MILVAASLFISVAHSRPTQVQTDGASVRQFVQSFYDWYAPLAQQFDPDHPIDPQAVTISKQELFSRALLTALAKAKREHASELASGELQIGDDFEPFLGAGINHGTYAIRGVKRKGATWFVAVDPVLEKGWAPQPTLTAVAEKTPNGWQFRNFIYDAAGWNLLDYLHELMPQPEMPPRTTYESGGLSASKVRWLKAEKLRCVVPTYIPAGMRLSSFVLGPIIHRDDAFIEITYAGKGGAEFTVEMASDGIGDVIFYPDRPLDPKLFSKRIVRNPVLKDMEVQSLDLPSERDFGVNWIDLGRLASPRFVCLTGKHLPVSEAVKIAKGLRFLN